MESSQYYSLRVEYFDISAIGIAKLEWESPTLQISRTVIPNSNLFHQQTCNCQNTGFTGDLCDLNINECASNPCQNGASCLDGINGFTCSCRAGFYGVQCEFLDSCFYNPCQNGGICTRDGSTYRCTCSEEFGGSNCETPRGLCAGPINSDPKEYLFTFPLSSSLTSKFKSNGDAHISQSSFILTSLANQHGSIYYSSPIIMTNPPVFSASFGFLITSPGGEGITFSIVTDSTLLETSSSSNLGYTGNPSIAIKFDTNPQQGEPFTKQYVAVLQNGNSVTPILALPEVLETFDNSQNWYVWIDYDGERLYLRYSLQNNRPTSPQLIALVSLAPLGNEKVFFGFTAASKTSVQHQILSNINFATDLKTYGSNCRAGEYYDLQEGQCYSCANSLYNDGRQGCCLSCPTNTISNFDRSSCISINNCLPNPCQNGGFCQNYDVTYFCICPIGFSGSKCEGDFFFFFLK